MKQWLVALAGNPNAGKSTIFNALTGSNQRVGNWPGKTVAKKEGKFTYQGHAITLVDLPGTYSLSAYSPEEVIARDFMVDAQPDVVIAVVDAANLERNLYLTVQVLEIGIPVVVALNMADIAEERGISVDVKRLSTALGVPVVRLIARQGEGFDDLLAELKRYFLEKLTESTSRLSDIDLDSMKGNGVGDWR